MNTILAIARNTYREAARQPIVWVLLLIFGGLIAASPRITLFALGDEGAMVREMGIASIALAGLLLVLLCATNLIHKEMESRTLQLMLSLPVTRTAVLLGKFLGIAAAVSSSTLLLGLILIMVLWTSSGMERIQKEERRERYLYRKAWSEQIEAQPAGERFSREHFEIIAPTLPQANPTFVSYLSMVAKTFLPGIWPLLQGLFLTLLQALVLAALASTLSVRFGLLKNAAIAFTFFALGHLIPHLQALGAASPSAAVRAISRWGSRLIPNLETFNLAAVVARSDGLIPLSYLMLASVTALLSIGVILAIGVLIFRRTEASGSSDGSG